MRGLRLRQVLERSGRGAVPGRGCRFRLTSEKAIFFERLSTSFFIPCLYATRTSSTAARHSEDAPVALPRPSMKLASLMKLRYCRFTLAACMKSANDGMPPPPPSGPSIRLRVLRRARRGGESDVSPLWLWCLQVNAIGALEASTLLADKIWANPWTPRNLFVVGTIGQYRLLSAVSAVCWLSLLALQ